MPTQLSSILRQVRTQLNDNKAKKYWSDEELLDHITNGGKDLWRAVIDLRQEHFSVTLNEPIAVGADSLSVSGVPSNVFRVLSLELRNPQTSGCSSLVFRPRKTNDERFVAARADNSSTSDNQSGVVYYALTGAGSPVGATTITLSDRVAAGTLLRLVYIPTLDAPLTLESINPIPGESDWALVAWTVAYARAKEKEDRMPDAGWLAVYATEKQGVLTASTPRQEAEPEYVDGMFDSYWGI